MRGVQGAVAQAVIRAFKCDDPAFAGGQQRGLERGFHRLETGVGENGFPGGLALVAADVRRRTRDLAPSLKRDPAQLAGEFRLEGMGVNVAHGVQQSGHLPLAGADHPEIRMAGGGHAKRGGQIEILFAFRIPNLHAPGALPDDRPPALRIHKGDVARFIVAQ